MRGRPPPADARACYFLPWGRQEMRELEAGLEAVNEAIDAARRGLAGRAGGARAAHDPVVHRFGEGEFAQDTHKGTALAVSGGKRLAQACPRLAEARPGRLRLTPLVSLAAVPLRRHPFLVEFGQ